MTPRRRTVFPLQLGGPGGTFTVERWLATSGDDVVAGAPVVAVRLAGARAYLCAPVSGTLTAVVAPSGATVQTGAPLGEVMAGISPAATTALLERLEDAENPQTAAILTMIELVEREDAALARVIRDCAIPRRFDAAVVALLTGADEETAAKWYEQLLDMQFVRIRRDGLACYDEAVRETLLEQWRAPLTRIRFDELNGRMRAQYDRERKVAMMHRNDLRQVAGTVRAANPSRYSELESIVSGRLRGLLTEILYHSAAISGEELLDRFQELAQDLEAEGQLLLGQTLVHTATKYLTMLQPDSPLFAWLRYWDGRLSRGLGARAEAEQLLAGLTDEGSDVKLRQWASSELGRLRYEQDRLPEAAQRYRAAIDLAAQPDADLWNLGNWYTSLGDVELACGELDAAVGHYAQAIEKSQAGAQHNVSAHVAASLGLGRTLRQLGRRREALEAALRSVSLLRSGLRTERMDQLSALTAVAELAAADEPRLSVTAFAEIRRLTDDRLEGPRAPEWPLRFVSAFIDADRIDEAARVLGELADGSPSSVRGLDIAFLNQRVRLDHLHGHYDRVIAAVSALLADPSREMEWEALTALSYRGLAYMAIGALPDAERDLTKAVQVWDRIGNASAVAQLRLDLADLSRRRGHLPEAAAVVDEAGHHLEQSGPGSAAGYHRMRAEILLDVGRAAEAAEADRLVLELAERAGAATVLMDALVHLARCESALGNWAVVGEVTRRAAGVAADLEARSCWHPDPVQERADRANADGVRLLVDPVAGPAAPERAKELFRAASGELPGHPWYQLNLAWAHAALGEWAEAVRAIERAIGLRRGPEPILSEQLARLLVELIDTTAPAPELLSALRAARGAGYLHWRLGVALHLREGDLVTQVETSMADAEAAYRHGLALAMEHDAVRDAARFHARLAALAAGDGRILTVRNHLDQAIGLLPAAGAGDLATDCRALSVSDREREVLLTALALIEEGPGEPGVRRRAAQARREMARRTRPVPMDDVPSVGTLLIEADTRLFPEGANTPGAQWMLGTGIPELRNRFESRTGLTLPGVLVRGAYVDRLGSYEVGHAGDVLGRGEVPLEGIFVLEPAPDGSAGNDPLTGRPAHWAPAAPAEPGKAIDPYGYLLRHLEAVAQADPARLLTVEQLYRLADEHAQAAPGRPALFEPGRPQRIRLLLSVCRGLLTDGCSIRRFATIAAAVTAAVGAVRARDIIAELRSVNRFDLLGPGTGPVLRLDAEAERLLSDALRETGQITPEASSRVRSAVASGMALVPTARALMVGTVALRSPVRRLIARDFPLLQVLAAEELLDPPLATVEAT